MWWCSGKESACQCKRCRFDPWVRKSPWRRKWQPTPVFLSRKFHGQRSLVGNSPWGYKTVKHNRACAHTHTHTPHTHTHTHTHTQSYYLICTELICTVKTVYTTWEKRCTILNKKSKLRNVINVQIMRYIYLFAMNLEK